MNLSDRLTDYVNAAFTGLWIETHEPDEAEREILRHAERRKWNVAVWDVAHGLRLPRQTGGANPDSGSGDPVAALRALSSLADANGTALLLLHNFHPFFNNVEVIQSPLAQLVP